LNFDILAATLEATPELASIPPPQENIEEQKEDEEGEGQGEKEIVQTDETEPITTETDNTDEDIIQKPDPEGPPRLPDDFYYEAEKVHAKPLTTNKNTFPDNTLSL
jgi:hypothetical protein